MPQLAREINFDTPVLKVSGLETKFDTSVISNSLVILIGDYLEARIVQQFHYWTMKEYGTVLNGLRWIYKPIRELLSEVLIGFTSWQVRMAIVSLVEKGLLLREHLFKEHHGHNFAPKNRTYYYSVNYQKLQELAQSQIAETPENFRFVRDTKLFCEKPQNKTNNTSIENNSRNRSLTTLSRESVTKKPLKQRKDLIPVQIETVLTRPVKNKINSVVSKAIEKETSSAAEKEIVKKNNLDKGITKPKPKVQKTKPGTKPKKKNKAPWKDRGELKRFYRELLNYTKVFGRNPHALTQHIINKLRRGELDPCWEDFKAGVPLGSSSQQEWEVEPGVPYPMFLEYLAEKLKGSHDGVEKAYEAALRILDEPKKAQVFWSQFKRSVINVSEQVEKERALGVSNPHTPVWSRERIEPTKEEAATAGKKIMGVNGINQAAIEANNNHQLKSQEESKIPDPWADEKEPQLTMREMLTLKLGERNLKGFVKQIPQVSQEGIEPR